MENAFSQFADQVIELVEGKQSAAAPARMARKRGLQPAPVAPQSAPITTPNQIVIPTITWDWPVAASGSIAPEQFLFADTVPQSVAKATEYAASSDSFSTNYRTFLECIDANKFPSPTLLAGARKDIQEPQGDPADSSSVPPGWTKVTTAGIQRWAPIWTLSRSAQDWTTGVQSGAISNPGSVVVQLQNAAGGDGVLQQKTANSGTFQSVPGAQAAFQKVTISAKAWGQIAIYPGTWFNSGVLRLGMDYVPDPNVFFGTTGLLRGRVSAFVVAYEAEFDFSSSAPVDAKLARALSGGAQLQAFGVPVSAPAPIAAGQQSSVVLKSTVQDPVIVLAILERYGASATS